MNSHEVTRKLDTLQAECATLKRYWTTVLPHVPMPDDAQFSFWVGVYGFPATHYGIRECGRKAAHMGFKMNAEHAVRFTSGIASQCPRADHRQPKPERIAEER